MKKVKLSWQSVDTIEVDGKSKEELIQNAIHEIQMKYGNTVSGSFEILEVEEPNEIEAIERQIVKSIVKSAIDLHFTVSLNDSHEGDGEWVIKKSTNITEIMDAIMSTGGDLLRFYANDGRTVGSVSLIYGNDGHDVVNDHTDSDEMYAVMHDANLLSEEFAEAS